MKKKISKLLICTVVMSTLLTGCKGDGSDISKMSKSQIIEQYNNLSASYDDLSNTLAETQKTLDSLSSDGTVSPAITTLGDGSNRLTFNSTDSKIIFPNTFLYPNSQAIVPDGKVNITSSVSVSPSSNWVLKINGSALEMEQSSGYANETISGTIKVNETNEQVTVEQLQSEVLAPWFENITTDSVAYTDIFVGNTSFGKQAEVPIMIDSENAYLICGMAAYGSYSVTYIFVYRGNQDTTKSELIKNIINTISIDGNNLIVSN